MSMYLVSVVMERDRKRKVKVNAISPDRAKVKASAKVKSNEDYSQITKIEIEEVQ